jgi:hypothetical protein
MFLVIMCQHASGTCQSHSHPVLSLSEASRKYIELSPSTPPFLTLRFHEKDLSPTLNLFQIQLILPLLGHILSSLKLLDNVAEHQDVEGPFILIRIQFNSTVEVARPIHGKFIFGLDCRNEMVHVLLLLILNAKIVNNQGEHDRSVVCFQRPGVFLHS